MEIKNLNISVKNLTLFKDFNLTLKDGEIRGIFAPTGAGKTTLLKFLCGLLESDADYAVNGKIIPSDLKVSMAFQDFRLLNELSVEKNILLPVEKLQEKTPYIKNAYNIMENLDVINKADIAVKNLSGGEQQRVGLARAFVYPASVYLLDEPFSNQDEEHIKNIIKLIKIFSEEKKSFIIVSHRMDLLKKLTRKILTEKDFIKS